MLPCKNYSKGKSRQPSRTKIEIVIKSCSRSPQRHKEEQPQAHTRKARPFCDIYGAHQQVPKPRWYGDWRESTWETGIKCLVLWCEPLIFAIRMGGFFIKRLRRLYFECFFKPLLLREFRPARRQPRVFDTHTDVKKDPRTSKQLFRSVIFAFTKAWRRCLTSSTTYSHWVNLPPMWSPKMTIVLFS